MTLTTPNPKGKLATIRKIVPTQCCMNWDTCNQKRFALHIKR